jgi:LacI family transcriptional regulator
MKSRRSVALCMDIRSSYDQGIARGVARYAKEKGVWQLFGYNWMLRPVASLRAWKGDGIISRMRSAREARRLRALGIPIVDVAGVFAGDGIFQATNDDLATGRLAGEHFLSRGFRRIAFCGVRAADWSVRRKAGLADAVRSVCAGIPAFEQSIGWWEDAAASGGLKEWLASLPLPCGVMAANDSVGVKVTRACRDIDIDVPREVAVMGVDNEEVLCEFSAPSLSSIPCDGERIGCEASALLDRLMSGRPAPVSSVRVPPRPPVIRQSTDTVNCGDALVAKAVGYIRENVGRGVSVYDVVDDAVASRRTLEVRFRRAMGRTIHDEIIRSRIDRACRLLAETEMAVAEVARAGGFGSQQRFYEAFRREKKMQPRAYRRMYRPSGPGHGTW